MFQSVLKQICGGDFFYANWLGDGANSLRGEFNEET